MQVNQAVQRFMDDRRYRGLAPKTIAAYKWALRRLPQPAHWPIERVELRGVIHDDRLAQVSRVTLFRHIRVFARWCSREFGVDDPTADLAQPKARRRWPRVLTREEVARVISAAETARDRALVALTVDTGIRLGELAALTWPAVTDAAVVVNGKTGPRVVPVSPVVRGMLDGLGDGHHIWIGRQGPLGYWGIGGAIRRTMKHAGIAPPRAGAHTLRHTFGSLFAAAGGPAFTLKRLMGHTSITTTQLYVNMATADVAEHHARYSPIAQIGLTIKDGRTCTN